MTPDLSSIRHGRMRNIDILPDNLPIPLDDKLVDHLQGLKIPPVDLRSTSGAVINLEEAANDPMVLFIYPRAGSPISPNKNVEAWDLLPGARGCTPQTCGYRDLHQEFLALGVQVFGLSIQSPEIQQEFAHRMQIPFQILSDENYKFTDALKLPTFEFEGERLIKRMAFFITESRIQKIFYPVFPPDQNASDVLQWLTDETRPFKFLHIRPIDSTDFAQWLPLWEAYNSFYKRTVPLEISAKTWERFLNPSEPMFALVAESKGQIVGFVHYLFHRNTATEHDVCYLQDLFTAEPARAQGVGKALINAVYEKAKNKGSDRVYWQTHKSNEIAKALYDKIANDSGFIVYSKRL